MSVYGFQVLATCVSSIPVHNEGNVPRYRASREHDDEHILQPLCDGPEDRGEEREEPGKHGPWES